MIRQNADRSTMSTKDLEERALILNRTRARINEIQRGIQAQLDQIDVEMGQIHTELTRRERAIS